MNIVLIGFMAVGKTLLGKLLAKRLNMEFVDTDLMISKKEGKTVTQIFDAKGEKYFRKLEKDIIKIVSRENNVVISTGGGVVLLSENMKRLKQNGIVICLKSSQKVLLERIKQQKGIRPLLNKPEPLKEIKSILKKRTPYYKQADFTVDTSNFDTNKIITRLVKKLVFKNFPC
ncbi:MAG: shikimate kinase [bacterium]